MTPDPLSLAATWLAGTAGAATLLAWARIGGVGLRLLLVVVAGAGVGGVGATGGGAGTVVFALVGLCLVVALVRRPRLGGVGWLMIVGAVLPLALAPGWLVGLGEATLLGSITVGLCLGHWFLVDPHLPRAPMRALAAAGLAGLVITAGVNLALPPASAGLSGLATPIAVVSGLITGVVLVAVLWALAVPTYKGVQSATGLFYVATMSVSAFVIVTSALRMAG